MPDSYIRKLHELAVLYGIQTSYSDVKQEKVHASPEVLTLILRSLGAPVHQENDVVEAIRERILSQSKKPLEPVVVAWEGKPRNVTINLPKHLTNNNIKCVLTLEDGSLVEVPIGSPKDPAKPVDGESYTKRKLSLGSQLPIGYHTLNIEIGKIQLESLIISAPGKGYAQPSTEKIWGMFSPLYSLHSNKSWGAGNLSDLNDLMNWVADHGGNIIGTLPIMASFLDEPFDPSPYATTSRLFWNEFYIDVHSIPEFQDSPAARSILAENQHLIEQFRRAEFIDYKKEMELKKRILLEVMRTFLQKKSKRQEDFWKYVKSHPYLEDYARFRAVGEKERSSWHCWPDALRAGYISKNDYDEERYRYHLFVQWIMDTQLRTLADEGRARNVRLYMDYPVGVHASSYDVWRHRKYFSDEMSVGAPPDAFFTGGQNWGFPPLHPEKIREHKYKYVIDSLRHNFKYAGVVRLDHVMGFHRLFWIPKGMTAAQGTYVRYPAEELYAILTLESHREKSVVVGEDLGIVPAAVRHEMDKRDLNRMYILQFEANHDFNAALRPVPFKYAASLNTHDTPPFAAYWKSIDIDERVEYGFLKPELKEAEYTARRNHLWSLIQFLKPDNFGGSDDEKLHALFRSCLHFLSRGDAWMVLVNLEDLWMETKSQNIPGTYKEHPNWLRRCAHSVESFTSMPFVSEVLKEIDILRKNSRYH